MFLAPRGCGFEQDCSQCGDLETRKRWGCDGPAAEPVASIACPFCEGRDEACTECRGTNSIDIYRCPNQIADERCRTAVAAAIMVEHGVLPESGGWQDQAAKFVQAYPLLVREIAQWNEARIELERKQAERKRK